MSVTATVRIGKRVNRYTIPLTSASDGTAGGLIVDANGSIPFDGTLMGIIIKPGTSGVQPTTLFDLVVTNEEGADVLGGLGANQANSGVYQDCPLGAVNGIPFVLSGNLTVAATNMGNAKSATLTLLVNNR